MTVIAEPIENIAGADNTTVFVFAASVVRESDDGDALVTTLTTRVTTTDGVLITPDLDAGPATVRIGLHSYAIDIPESPSPVRLWPLVEAGLPVPPSQEAQAVRNGGGIARIQRISASAYAALVTPDPETLYIVVPD
jgi:hypothetical protein